MLRAIGGPEHGLADAVGQVGELEVWEAENGRYGVSFFWPAARPDSQKPLMQQAWTQDSQEYFHSSLNYELMEDGKTIKLCHGQDCLVFELLEEERSQE